MTKVEEKFFDFIKNNIIYIIPIAATILGIVIRYCGFNFQSDDFNSFLNPWWSAISAGGIKGLAQQVGNYNIPYQIITYILTLFPFEALHSYKLFSVIFDFVLAISAALVVKEFDSNNSRLRQVLTYSVVFCSITVIFNSSFWAQCDSIYVSLILLAIYFVHRHKNIAAFVLLGAAFAFKLQTVFILPVFLYLYISNRKISILHFLLIPVTDIVMCLPAVFLGRNFSDIFTIYVDQTDYGKQIQMNCPNFWALICDRNDTTYYYLFKTISIAIAVLALGIGLSLIIHKSIDLMNRENFLLTSIWTVFTCVMFLSSMHERYGYLLDILTIIYAVFIFKRVWLAVLCNLVSLRGYCFYLFTYDVLDIKLTAIIYTATYAYVTYLFIKEVIMNGKKLEISKKIDEAKVITNHTA